MQIIFNKKLKTLHIGFIKNEKYNYVMNKMTNIYQTIYKKRDVDDDDDYETASESETACENTKENIDDFLNKLLNEENKKTI